jgi:hypothetical protein
MPDQAVSEAAAPEPARLPRWTPPGHIRVIAIGLVFDWGASERWADWTQASLLVFEGFDDVKQRPFFRPLGGGVEFGETSQEALRREFREEIQQELSSLEYLATLENLYTLQGVPGHEIVQVYRAQLADQNAYGQQFEVREPDQDPMRAWFKPMTEFLAQPELLTPGRLWDILDALKP